VPWERVGDSAATHPIVLRGSTVSGADSRTRVELFGFVTLCGSISAQHLTDSIVELGAAEIVGGSNTERLLAQSVEAGYMAVTRVNGRKAWKIVADDDLIHIRTREEVQWDRQRKADNGKTDLTLQVQLRDGSACRRCGKSVSWTDRVGGRGATYDHLVKPARSAEDMVVTCRSCNSARGEPGSDQAAGFDRRNPLLPVPSKPLYCEYLRARLAKHGIEVSAPEVARPDVQSGDVPSSEQRTTKRPRDQRGNAEDNGTVKPGRPGSGVQKSTFPGRDRARSGRSGQVRDGPGGSGKAAPAAKRRRRRPRGGKRGRPPGSDQ
jgi:5-methylcytosine-specific restriction endonuclease McrA